MKFKIPFTNKPSEVLKKRSKLFISAVKYKKKSKLSEYLRIANVGLTREDYLGIIRRNFLINLIIITTIITLLFFILNIEKFYITGPLISLFLTSIILINQLLYPILFIKKREREIEKNLLPALEDMLIQLNSGIPLFNVLVNISSADYGELSEEIKKAVKKISGGIPEEQALEELSKDNPSRFLKMTLWQISNGMKSGSDMTIVIRDSIKTLREEQMIQIQNYGNKLNPLIVFYMLIAVIVPALSVTFLTIVSSIISLQKESIIMMFLGLAIGVVFIQILFIGVIKSARPTLI